MRLRLVEDEQEMATLSPFVVEKHGFGVDSVALIEIAIKAI